MVIEDSTLEEIREEEREESAPPRSDFPDNLMGDSQYVYKSALMYWKRTPIQGIENTLKDSGLSDEVRSKAVSDFVDEMHASMYEEKTFPLNRLRGYMRNAHSIGGSKTLTGRKPYKDMNKNGEQKEFRTKVQTALAEKLLKEGVPQDKIGDRIAEEQERHGIEEIARSLGL